MTSRLTHLPELCDAADRAPVELHAAADAVHARADHHDVLIGEAQVVLGAVVRQVQVVREGGPLGRHRVDLLHHGQDGPIVTQLPHDELCAVDEKALIDIVVVFVASYYCGA